MIQVSHKFRKELHIFIHTPARCYHVIHLPSWLSSLCACCKAKALVL